MVPPGHRFRDEHAAWLASRCRRVETVELTKAEGLREAALGLARGWPFQIGYMLSPRRSLRRPTEWAQAEGYDLAYAYYIRSTEALRAVVPFVPVTFLALQLSSDAQHAAPFPNRGAGLGAGLLPLRAPAHGRLRGPASGATSAASS